MFTKNRTSTSGDAICTTYVKQHVGKTEPPGQNGPTQVFGQNKIELARFSNARLSFTSSQVPTGKKFQNKKLKTVIFLNLKRTKSEFLTL